MRTLQIITCAYRATAEEQDDTVVWITHAMRGAGGELDVLLRANAVSYAVTGQDAEGLSFGDWQQTQPPCLPRDINGLIDKGVSVYVADEDASDRGISDAKLLDGVRRVGRSELAALVLDYDRICLLYTSPSPRDS